MIVHELGHLLAARSCNVPASELGLGMGPRLTGFRLGNIQFNLRAIPIGSFVMLDGTVLKEKSVRAQLLVHLGGDVYIIRGMTLPGSNVRVSGRETPALSDGTFQIQITAPANVREVNVQASDSQGNTSSYRVTLTRTS